MNRQQPYELALPSDQEAEWLKRLLDKEQRLHMQQEQLHLTEQQLAMDQGSPNRQHLWDSLMADKNSLLRDKDILKQQWTYLLSKVQGASITGT